MASSSGRKSGSSGRSTGSRRRVVIGADETVRVTYERDRPKVETERRRSQRQSGRTTAGARQGRPRSVAEAGKKMAAQKRDEREVRRRSIRRKRVGVVLGVALAAVALAWGVLALWNAPLFAADSIAVTGQHRLSRGEVLKMAAVPPNATLLRLPVAEIKRRLTASPWISAVEVHRQFPHAVYIAITERVPVAVAEPGDGAQWLVSGDGHWLTQRSKEDTATFVVIRDIPGLAPIPGSRADAPEMKNALAVIQGLSPRLLDRVVAVSAPTVEKTALLLKKDVQVFVGKADDLEQKDKIALAILAKQKRLVYINVRVIDRPTWRGLDDK